MKMLRSFSLGTVQMTRKGKKYIRRAPKCHLGCFLTARRLSSEFPRKDKLPESAWKTKQMPGFLVRKWVDTEWFFHGAFSVSGWFEQTINDFLSILDLTRIADWVQDGGNPELMPACIGLRINCQNSSKVSVTNSSAWPRRKRKKQADSMIEKERLRKRSKSIKRRSQAPEAEIVQLATVMQSAARFDKLQNKKYW